ncbi:serine/arginine repetitive matrix protein 1 [Drosophila busckii]|nr:serine/arginine repetitive matrix protein 1 [Drosophila busckii]
MKPTTATTTAATPESSSKRRRAATAKRQSGSNCPTGGSRRSKSPTPTKSTPKSRRSRSPSPTRTPSPASSPLKAQRRFVATTPGPSDVHSVSYQSILSGSSINSEQWSVQSEAIRQPRSQPPPQTPPQPRKYRLRARSAESLVYPKITPERRRVAEPEYSDDNSKEFEPSLLTNSSISWSRSRLSPPPPPPPPPVQRFPEQPPPPLGASTSDLSASRTPANSFDGTSFESRAETHAMGAMRQSDDRPSGSKPLKLSSIRMQPATSATNATSSYQLTPGCSEESLETRQQERLSAMTRYQNPPSLLLPKRTNLGLLPSLFLRQPQLNERLIRRRAATVKTKKPPWQPPLSKPQSGLRTRRPPPQRQTKLVLSKQLAHAQRWLNLLQLQQQPQLAEPTLVNTSKRSRSGCDVQRQHEEMRGYATPCSSTSNLHGGQRQGRQRAHLFDFDDKSDEGSPRWSPNLQTAPMPCSILKTPAKQFSKPWSESRRVNFKTDVRSLFKSNAPRNSSPLPACQHQQPHSFHFQQSPAARPMPHAARCQQPSLFALPSTSSSSTHNNYDNNSYSYNQLSEPTPLLVPRGAYATRKRPVQPPPVTLVSDLDLHSYHRTPRHILPQQPPARSTAGTTCPPYAKQRNASVRAATAATAALDLLLSQAQRLRHCTQRLPDPYTCSSPRRQPSQSQSQSEAEPEPIPLIIPPSHSGLLLERCLSTQWPEQLQQQQQR